MRKDYKCIKIQFRGSAWHKYWTNTVHRALLAQDHTHKLASFICQRLLSSSSLPLSWLWLKQTQQPNRKTNYIPLITQRTYLAQLPWRRPCLHHCAAPFLSVRLRSSGQWWRKWWQIRKHTIVHYTWTEKHTLAPSAFSKFLCLAVALFCAFPPPILLRLWDCWLMKDFLLEKWRWSMCCVISSPQNRSKRRYFSI